MSFKVIAFQRLNKMDDSERKEIILDAGYIYFQAFHDCLYCYDTLENVKYPDSPIYTLDFDADAKGKFVLVQNYS